MYERENEIFTKLGCIDNQHLAKRIRAEVLMPVGLMDTICPSETLFYGASVICAAIQKDTVLVCSKRGLLRHKQRFSQ